MITEILTVIFVTGRKIIFGVLSCFWKGVVFSCGFLTDRFLPNFIKSFSVSKHLTTVPRNIMERWRNPKDRVLEQIEQISIIATLHKENLACALSSETDVDDGKSVDQNAVEKETLKRKLEQDMDEIIRRAKIVEELMNRSFFRKKLAVQLVCSTQLSRDVHHNLKKYLQKMAKIPTDCTIRDLRIIDESKPLLVVCLNLSRLEADIDTELHLLNNSDDTRQQQRAVLILHLGSENSLPRLPTSTQVGTQSKYAGLTLIDLAYDQDSHKFEMNQTAKDALNEFLTRCSIEGKQ